MRVLNDRSLHSELNVFVFPNLIVGSIFVYFLKY